MRVSFYDVLAAHAAAYPQMEPCDYVKLAYQNEFGCGHLLADREAAYQALLAEWDSVRPDVLEPLTVSIGGGYARLNLAAAKTCMPPELVFAMFEKSLSATGSMEAFRRKISLIQRSAKMGILPCDGDAVAACAAGIEDGLPHHSARFRHLYGAHYRVISSDMATVAPLCLLLADAAKKAPYVNVAIDGRSGTGKTFVAGILADLFDGTVISMDDYFLPQIRKTAERLAEPGGNVDYERFAFEITGERYADTLTHAVFDCRKQVLGAPQRVERKPFLFVEGTYSLHPELRDFYDVRIFLDADAETRRLRLTERDGEAGYQRYLSEWAPLEDRYVSETVPQLAADLLIHT